MLALNNAIVVTGDGRTVLEPGSVLIEGERIVAVRRAPFTASGSDGEFDLGGRLLMPGAIDPHSHGGTTGPLFASGAPALSKEQALVNLDTHLRQGHTTVVNLDGFALPEEVAQTAREHVINLLMATVHLPVMIEAARRGDGSGLTPAHEAMTAERMKAAGAVVIGEVGAGHTLGGGGQDYMYIPAAIKRETGRVVESRHCTALKYAVLGRRVRPEEFDGQRLAEALRAAGLDDVLTPERAKGLIEDSVLPSFALALEGIGVAASEGLRLGLPVLVHNSAPSEEAVLAAADQAGSLLIAGHTNHSTFTVEECVLAARRLKKKGAWIEGDTFDAFGLKRLDAEPTRLWALLEAGLVDVIATDYAAGHWDSVYLAIEHAVRAGVTTLPAAVAMVSTNVVRAIPAIGGDRGRIADGAYADVVVAGAGHPGAIERVFVQGREVREVASKGRPPVSM